jgi:hypothetical protein
MDEVFIVDRKEALMYTRIRFFLLILSVILFAYGCQPGTQDGWHVFTHPEYGFSFEYPAALDRKPLNQNCGIDLRPDSSVHFGAVSSVEVIETQASSLDDYLAQFLAENPEYQTFTTTSGVNTSGLESLTLEYSQGAPRADHHVTFFANDIYGVAFHHYFRAPICLTRDASIEDYKIYEHAVESFKFPP